MIANITQKRQLLKRKEQLIHTQEHKIMDIRLFPRMPNMPAVNENIRCSTAQLKQFSILLDTPKIPETVHRQESEVNNPNKNHQQFNKRRTESGGLTNRQLQKKITKTA